MSGVTDADRERAAAISEHCMGGARCAALDEGACDCGVDELREDIAAALAEEREKATLAERSDWNPIVGRVLIVTQEWQRSADPRLVACAEQIHNAITNKADA